MCAAERAAERRPFRVQVASLLERAMKHRAVGATALNEHSSRSHMVFMLSISGRNTASGQTVSGAPPQSALGHPGYSIASMTYSDTWLWCIASDASAAERERCAHVVYEQPV
jgi:hypothetical protein